MQEKLYIYIDESGDTGLKSNSGSSLFFIVSLIIINKTHLQKLSDSIERTVRQIIGSKKFEIKFSKTSIKHKVSFFDAIKFIQFESSVFIFEKKSSRLSYEECIITSLRPTLDIKKQYSVFIDGLNKKSFSGKNIETIRKSFSNISKIYLIDSKKNYLVQLADMIAGLVHSVYKNITDYEQTLNTLKHKIKITHIK